MSRRKVKTVFNMISDKNRIAADIAPTCIAKKTRSSSSSSARGSSAKEPRRRPIRLAPRLPLSPSACPSFLLLASFVVCLPPPPIPCHAPSLHRSCPRSLPVRSPPRPPPPLDSPCAPPAARRRSWGCTSVLQAKCVHMDTWIHDRRRSAGDKPLGGGPCSHGRENPVDTWKHGHSDMDTIQFCPRSLAPTPAIARA